jgi:hypothetical protein
MYGACSGKWFKQIAQQDDDELRWFPPRLSNE